MDHALGDVLNDRPVGPGTPSGANLVVKATRSCIAASSGSESQPTGHEHHLPGRSHREDHHHQCVRSAHPGCPSPGLPVFLHGYRQLWVDIFYATAAVGTITGITGRYRMVRRNRKSSSRHGPPPTFPTVPDTSEPIGEMAVDVYGPVAAARRTDTKV
jgi:hypothetical protein